jgi:hypothetical protein
MWSAARAWASGKPTWILIRRIRGEIDFNSNHKAGKVLGSGDKVGIKMANKIKI